MFAAVFRLPLQAFYWKSLSLFPGGIIEGLRSGQWHGVKGFLHGREGGSGQGGLGGLRSEFLAVF